MVWVKFIKRKIGKSIYTLNPDLVFNNCDRLMLDEDEFVQKSVGWLLKVTAVHHQQDVIEYLKCNIHIIQRSTLRYALEKVDVDSRKSMLAYS